MSSRKTTQQENQNLDRNYYVVNENNTITNFDRYNTEWDKELNSMVVSSQKNFPKAKKGNLATLTSNDFEQIARDEERKNMNQEIYDDNNDLFISSIKSQIFAETHRLLSNGGSISNEKLNPLDDKYRTGNDYDDMMINVASSENENLLKVFDKQSSGLNRNNNHDNADDEFDRDNFNQNRYGNDWINSSNLSPEERAKIKAYTRYAENMVPTFTNLSEEEKKEWLKYRNDIARYGRTNTSEELVVNGTTIDSPINGLRTEPLNSKDPASPKQDSQAPSTKQGEQDTIKTFEDANKGFVSGMPEHVDSKLISEDLKVEDNIDFALKTNETSRPSFKEQAPIVTNDQRVTNVKNIEDTDWEKIKNYVKDFNTAADTVAIGNVPQIVDADNALKVDLNQKFYLTKEELNAARDKQARQFQAIIDDYEETLKKHETLALHKIYDDINKKPEVIVDKSELARKLNQQNDSNLKVIKENLELKKQIEELEEKLKQPAPVPEVKPKMAKFEMEAEIVEVLPEVKEEPQPIEDQSLEESSNSLEKQPKKFNTLQVGQKKMIQLRRPGQNYQPLNVGHINKAQPQQYNSLKKNTANSATLIANTLERNRMSALEGAVDNQKKMNTPMDQNAKININEIRRNAGNNTAALSGPNDEINRIISIKEAYGKK